MRVVYKVPGEHASVIEIPNNLRLLQELVGGYIETVPYNSDAIMIVNEEGKILGLEPNVLLGNDVVVGNLIVVGDGGEDFAELDLDRAKEISMDLDKKGAF